MAGPFPWVSAECGGLLGNMFTSKNEATLRLANPRKSKTLAIALAPKIFGMDLNFVKNASELFLDCEHILSSPGFSREGVPELLRGAWISSAARYRVLKCEHSLTRPFKKSVLYLC